jgi:ethanolamine utilization cobalamin adenosyltransferase
MLYTEQMVRDNIRTRQGQRVFFLNKGDTLTPGARDFLTRERIGIRPASEAAIREYELAAGGTLTEKPEEMTHLQGNILVRKDHPRIAFRGALDSLQAEILLCQLEIPGLRRQLGELLEVSRRMVRCEVLEEPLEIGALCGMTAEELRARSHRPQEFYGQGHFRPEVTDGAVILRLNRLRALVRSVERLVLPAFPEGREDLLQTLNRMSSLVYIWMIREKAGGS